MISAKKVRAELAAIVWVSLSIFVAFSLWSYHSTDTSLHTLSWGKPIQNWCGIAGSFISDLLLRGLGLGAWILVAQGLVRGFQIIFNQHFEWSWARLAWGVSLLILSVALIGIHFPKEMMFNGQIHLGGLIGMIFAQGFVIVFNSVGAKIVFWSAWTFSFVMFYEKAVTDLFKFIFKSSLAIAQKLLSTLSTAVKNFIKDLKGHSGLEPTKKKETKSKPLLAKEQEDEDEEEDEELDDEVYAELKFEEAEQLELSDDELPILNSSESFLSSKDSKRKVKLKFKRPNQVENWSLPKLELVEDPPATRVRIDQNEIKERARILKEKLALFGVTGEVVAAKAGPAVTLYEFRPDSSVKISKITELADDLSMALSSESLRIIAPIPGRDVVGIETANRQRETVYHKDMLAEEKFWSEDLKLPMALGRKVDGSIEIADLRKMPHLLIAGTTGSGKSVFTVSTIIGLIYRHSPKTLKLILIDPKQVDLAAFEKIPHLAMPLVTDSKQAVLSLKWAVNEMEKRYRSMSQFGARGIEAFNEAVSELSSEQKKEHEQINFEYETTPGKRGELYYYEPQPYLVIVVEEFADLMSVDKGNVEHSVIRLAQKARACGIHLILCLQSPRKEFVTGAIKSNIPGRIAFKAASSTESRIILDETGAERLLASGDMLYRGPGSAHVIRHHGPFLKDKDIANVTQSWSDQAEPVFDENVLAQINGSESDSSVGFEGMDDEQDDKYNDIVNWMQTQKEVSASLIQRRFALGYPRAARIMESFERNGLVGPANGSKPRAVLIHNLKDL